MSATSTYLDLIKEEMQCTTIILWLWVWWVGLIAVIITNVFSHLITFIMTGFSFSAMEEDWEKSVSKQF